MSHLRLICFVAMLSFAHTQNPRFDVTGDCVFFNGNCGFGTKTVTCSRKFCSPIQTKTVMCFKMCGEVIEKLKIQHERVIERISDPEQDNYYSWSSWSKCSSSCGMGMQIQTRDCKLGPGNCTGIDERTRACTPDGECVFQSCEDVPGGTFDENFEQCDDDSPVCGNWEIVDPNWKIGSGQTSTPGTGPKYDNTFQKDCGKYVYFDPSVLTSGLQEMRMATPVSTNATSCLSFSLSMFSKRPTDIGLFTVKIEGSENTLYQRDGGHGSRRQGWEPVKINVPEGSNFTIVFGAEANAWRSDIAIDDIIFTENQKCDEGVDGNWGLWGNWSLCDPSCGCGQRTRSRNCDSPAPTNDGLPCVGSDQEIELCEDLAPCPVNGEWGIWSSYSVCEQTCGDEYQIRTRECEGHIGDGLKCFVSGSDGTYALSEYESRKCSLPQCIDDATPVIDVNTRCPDGWIEFRVDRDNGDSDLNCYKFSESTATYTEAKAMCNDGKPNGFLTSILTGDEEEFLLKNSEGDFFIGAKGTSRDGVYIWTDDKSFSYNNVASGQTLDCAYANKTTGLWYNHPCDSSDTKYFVCKAQADLWNPWSSFSDCSATCSVSEGVKVRSRTCLFPTDSHPFECIPSDPLNIKRKGGITSEFQILPCTSTTGPACPGPVWSGWSLAIGSDSLTNVRVCGNGDEDNSCEQQEGGVYSSNKRFELETVPVDCGSGWEKMVSSTGETTCWHISESNSNFTYNEAKSYCTEEGGEIASIISYEEQKFVMNMFPTLLNDSFPDYCTETSACSYWIGALNDSSTLLGWSWEDGTPMGYSYFNSGYSQTDTRLALLSSNTYKWDVVPESDEYNALCKKFIFSRRECPSNFVRVGDECFYIESTPANMTDARSACIQMGADIASITNLDAQIYINNFAGAFIGGEVVETGEETTPIWYDGTYWSPFLYSEGIPGKEVTGSDGECLYSNSTEGWYTTDCTENKPYICKTSLVPKSECPEGWEHLITPDGLQCYYIGEEYGTSSGSDYYHAIKECQTRGSDLAKLDDPYERTFAIYIAKNSQLNGDFLIGVNSGNTPEVTFEDGEEINFAVFVSAQPVSNLCGQIDDTFSFNFDSCTTPYNFICQRNYY